MRLRTLFFFIYLALTYVGPARAEDFVIGVLNDQSGPYADLTGPGGAEIAQMAIEDFGGSVLGKPIVLVVGDHQNKADVGVAIARQWYDERKVKAIFDITNSAVGLAIQELTKSRNRLVVFDSAASSDFTGKACSPNGIQWNADTWSNGVPLVRLLIKQNLDSFFFITADYAFGAAVEADARDAIAKAGGTVVGGVRSPSIPPTTALTSSLHRPRRLKLSCSQSQARIYPTRSSRPASSISPRGNISRLRSPISATSTPLASTWRTGKSSCSPGIGT
jgi:ABC-type branched-subunit amino acid transport system substrate-binding protein